MRNLDVAFPEEGLGSRKRATLASICEGGQTSKGVRLEIETGLAEQKIEESEEAS